MPRGSAARLAARIDPHGLQKQESDKTKSPL